MLSNELSNTLLKEKGHYVQAINYPTVPRGQEKLRIAVTPHHTKEMMDGFVGDLVEVWREMGMPLEKKEELGKELRKTGSRQNLDGFQQTTCSKCSNGMEVDGNKASGQYGFGKWMKKKINFCEFVNCPIRQNNVPIISCS